MSSRSTARIPKSCSKNNNNYFVMSTMTTLALGVGCVKARPLGGGWGSPSYEGVHRIIRKKVPRTKKTQGRLSSLALTGSWSTRRKTLISIPGQTQLVSLVR